MPAIQSHRFRSQTPLAELEQIQAQLQERERHICESAYLRRTDALEAMRDAIGRLGELGSPEHVLSRAPKELGIDSQFERILISEVEEGRMTPRTLWERDGDPAHLPQEPVTIDYPLVEQTVLADRAAALVVVADAGPRTPAVLTRAFAWSGYVVAPIVVEGEAIGLLHADAGAGGRRLDELDREIVSLACAGLGDVFERVIARDTLRRHRAQLQSAAGWLNDRLRRTGGMAGDASLLAGSAAAAVESLTAREREVLTLMARGQTNGQIAAELGVREGTVKYHVKNVLRKLGARSRADAVARSARATGLAG